MIHSWWKKRSDGRSAEKLAHATDLVLCNWIVITDASMCVQPVGGCYELLFSRVV